MNKGPARAVVGIRRAERIVLREYCMSAIYSFCEINGPVSFQWWIFVFSAIYSVRFCLVTRLHNLSGVRAS